MIRTVKTISNLNFVPKFAFMHIEFSSIRFSFIRLFVSNSFIRIKFVYSYRTHLFGYSYQNDLFVYLYQIRLFAYLSLIHDWDIHFRIKFVYSYQNRLFFFFHRLFRLFVYNFSFIYIKSFVYSFQLSN